MFLLLSQNSYSGWFQICRKKSFSQHNLGGVNGKHIFQLPNDSLSFFLWGFKDVVIAVVTI